MQGVMDDYTIGLALRILRNQRGLTLEQVAARCGWKKSKVSNMERGITALRHVEVQEYAAAIGLGTDVVDDLASTLHERLAAHGLNARWEQMPLGLQGLDLSPDEQLRRLDETVALERAS